ncbi:MAG: Zn-ribbon domain-containing OB-fold protein [Candidatus Micrarchaeaceae archaeon]
METAPAGTWRKFNASYNLVGTKCEKCGTTYFPPRIICKNCGRESKMKEFKLSGNGEIYTYTKIHSSTETFKEDTPYIIVMVKTDEGPLIEGHLIDNGKDPKIGARVKVVFRKMFAEGDEGLIHYHYKFEII